MLSYKSLLQILIFSHGDSVKNKSARTKKLRGGGAKRPPTGCLGLNKVLQRYPERFSKKNLKYRSGGNYVLKWIIELSLQSHPFWLTLSITICLFQRGYPCPSTSIYSSVDIPVHQHLSIPAWISLSINIYLFKRGYPCPSTSIYSSVDKPCPSTSVYFSVDSHDK